MVGGGWWWVVVDGGGWWWVVAVIMPQLGNFPNLALSKLPARCLATLAALESRLLQSQPLTFKELQNSESGEKATPHRHALGQDASTPPRTSRHSLARPDCHLQMIVVAAAAAAATGMDS